MLTYNPKYRPISEATRKAVITLQALPTQRYRRQAVKDGLDIVGGLWFVSAWTMYDLKIVERFLVSVGGILSLFLGASILSGVEFIYFFTIRLMGTAWMNRQKRNRGVKIIQHLKK